MMIFFRKRISFIVESFQQNDSAMEIKIWNTSSESSSWFFIFVYRSKSRRDEDRDVSEKIALGLPNAGVSSETMYDQRLFDGEAVGKILTLISVANSFVSEALSSHWSWKRSSSVSKLQEFCSFFLSKIGVPPPLMSVTVFMRDKYKSRLQGNYKSSKRQWIEFILWNQIEQFT